jgi:ActR/RegA family two-component response regulator
MMAATDHPEHPETEDDNKQYPHLRSLAEVRAEHIERVLTEVKGNKTAAARILGVDRRTLYRHISALKASE